MTETIDTTRRGLFKSGFAGLAFGGLAGQAIFEDPEVEAAAPPSKFTGDAYYDHKEPWGTCTVWFITRFEAFDGPEGECFRAYPWPGPGWTDDFIYLFGDDVEDFIHKRA